MAVNQDYSVLRERYQQRQAERQKTRASHTEALKNAFMQRQAQRGITSDTSQKSGAFDTDPRKMAFLQRQLQRGNISEEQAMAQIYKPYNDFIDRVKGVVSGYEQFANNYNTRFGGRNMDLTDAYVGDSQQYLDNVTAYQQRLIAESDAILATLEANPDAFDAETVNNIKQSLYQVRENTAEILEFAGQDNDYWNSWGKRNEDKWAGLLWAEKDSSPESTYQKAQQDQAFAQKYAGKTGTELINLINFIKDEDEKDWVTGEALRTLSFDEATNDLKVMKAEFAEIEANGDLINHYEQGLALDWEREQAALAAIKRRSDIYEKYGVKSLDEFRDSINRNEQLIAESERVQEYTRLSSVKENEDFEKYVKIGRDEADAYNEKNNRTETMTASEVKVLAYYIAKDRENGTNLAEQYKAAIDNYLKHRRAEEIAYGINNIDIPVIEDAIRTGYSFTANMANWGMSVAQNFTDKTLDPTIFQLSNNYVGSDPSLNRFEKTLWSAAGVMGYMAPSILISKGVGAITGIPSVAKAAGSVAMYLGSAGQAYGEALEKGYNRYAARTYSTLVGLSEVALQNAIGGISEFGGLPAMLEGKIAGIKHALLKGVAKYGVRIVGEIGEEELQNILEPAFRTIVFGEKYDMPTWQEIIDTAIVTAISTGALEGKAVVKETIEETRKQKLMGDQISQHSFLTSRERVVVNTLTEKLVAEAELSGDKLSVKEKQAIYDQVVEDMNAGRIDIKDIEDSIGKGNKYEQLVSEFEEFKKLNSMKAMEMTGEQSDRLAELKAKNQENNYEKAIKDYDGAFSQAVESLVKSDRLAESYREQGRKSEAFKVEDLSQYSEKQRKVVQSAIDSGILNNTNRTHEFVDFIAKVSERLGVDFSFTDNKRLKESGFAIDGVAVNGYVNEKGVTVNVNSAKALNSVVGHEIAHVLEGTKLYDSLMKAVKAWGNTKGIYETKLKELTELYQGKEGYTGEDAAAKIEREVVAELIGDYLFTDKAFVENLAKENPGLFKRIFEEIKHLCKLVTAGSKEARQLEKVKKIFQDVYREASETGIKNPTAEGGVKYSLTGKTTPTYKELVDKPPVKIVDVMHGVESGSYADMKDSALSVAKRDGWFEAPHHNADTNSMIFITEKSFTHAYSNLRADFGEDTIRCMAHIPEIIENSVLVSVDKPRDPTKQETKVYTFMGAVEGVDGVEPVKLTVKEYDFATMDAVPKNIREYFEKNGVMETYESLYDAQALEVIGVKKIKKESDASGKVYEQSPEAQATSDSKISIAELLSLVKGDAAKYIPKQSDVRKSLSAQGQAESGGQGWQVRGQDVALEQEQEGLGLPLPPGYQEGSKASQTAREIGLPMPPGYQEGSKPAQPAREVGLPLPPGYQEGSKPAQPAREVGLPLPPGYRSAEALASNSNGKDKQHKWVKTSTESNAVSRAVLLEDLDQSKITYTPISNKETLGKANAKLYFMGYDSAVSYFNNQIYNDKVGLDDIAMGERLIQEAVKRGDTKTAGELIQNVAILGTELGQKVQALSIIKRLTPEGQLGMLQKIVNRGKAKGDVTFNGVEITQEMIDYILSTYNKDGTYDQKKLNKAVEDVKQKIADQMTVTKGEKVNAWRYLSMLGNPKTHIRNVVSNIANMGTIAVKDVIARTAEGVFSVENRTKTWKKASDLVKTYARETATEMKNEITGEGKYSDTADIKAKRQIFQNSILQKVYDFNSDMLSKEDWWFSKVAFQNSLQEFLAANGIETAEDIHNNPEIVEKAKRYALERAEIATFRQYSWLASKISSIERKNTVFGVAVGSVIPFKKTPVNVAKAGLSYSPLGFAKTLTYDIAQVKKGNMDASTLVDHLAQNITGTGLALAGYLLASVGFLNGAGEDDKEGAYDYHLGEQAYSVNVGGNTYSLSWLSPTAMPLFVGANLYEQLVEGKEWNADVLLETLAQTLDPLSEMSFLSSLDDVLSSYDSGVEKFAGIGMSALTSYASQFVPTVLSQTAATVDDTKRTTKVAANSGSKVIDDVVHQLQYKIPVLRQLLQPSTDIWGNEIKQSENFVIRAIENYVAPWSRKTDISSEVDDEIKSLYSMVGEDSLLPGIPKSTVTYNGTKYPMSAQEYTTFKKTYGQIAYSTLEKLFQTETYRNADPTVKVEMIRDAYTHASDTAKREYLGKRDVEYTNATKDGIPYYKENTIIGAIKYDVSVEEYELFSATPRKYALAQAVGGYERYKTYQEELEKLKSDKNTAGKTVADSRKKKVIEYINNLDAEYGEKIILYKSLYPGDDTYNWAIVDYLNDREDINYSEMESILIELGFHVDEDGRITW